MLRPSLVTLVCAAAFAVARPDVARADQSRADQLRADEPRAEALPTEPARSGEYRLHALDRLRVKVLEWRASADKIYEWEELTGEYAVQPGGAVMLPMADGVPAAGRTPAELARAIGERLQRRMGLYAAPDVSIEIVEYAPLYVAGDVDKPGEQRDRPGLTVLQALALAGGLPRSGDLGLARFEREAIGARGEIEAASLEIAALSMRAARLAAEAKAAAAFEPPQIEPAPSAPTAALLRQQETAILNARETATQTEIAALEQLKKHMESEIRSLDGQLAAEAKQAGLVRTELEGVRSLVERGLAVAQRRLALERQAAQSDADRLKLEQSVLRARQEISRADIGILELRNKRRTEATIELRDVEQKLAAARVKLAAAQDLLDDSLTRAPAAWRAYAEGRRRAPRFRVWRVVDGAPSTREASGADPLGPGDTLEVILPRPTTEDGRAGLAAAPGG